MSEFLKKLIAPALKISSNRPPDNFQFLDSCISSASDGYFSSYNDAVSEFILDYNSYEDKNSFLIEECGIDLSNGEDSGSIVGTSAGGKYITGNHFVPYADVPEDLPLICEPNNWREFVNNILGIPVIYHSVFDAESDPDSTLVDKLLLLYRYSYHSWIPTILQRIYESFGVSYEESEDIVPFSLYGLPFNINYDNPYNYASWYPGLGRGQSIPREGYYEQQLFRRALASVDANDVGRVSFVSAGVERTYYLDSELAIGLISAVFDRIINWYSELPAFFIHGIPDVFIGQNFRGINLGFDYISYLSDEINCLTEVLVYSHRPILSNGEHVVVATFLRWLEKRFRPKAHTPFLNRLVYGLNLYDKFYTDVEVVVDLSIQYATKLTNMKKSYVNFIREYISKVNVANIDSSLLSIANINFTNDDCGAYGGLDSEFVDYIVKRQDRFRILNMYSYLNQVDTLYYSFSYYAKYEKNIYKVRYLTIQFVELPPDVVNRYYKVSIISRLVRGVFKPILQCLDYYLNLRFDEFSFCKLIHVDFDDDPTPIRPCRYQVGFDESGKVNSMLITFYTHAYIPIDDRDTMPALGYYTGNYLLYIFCILVILSKLKHADLFYRHPIIIAIAIALVGYDELGEDDIKQTAVNGKTEEYAVGGIVGD